MSTSRRPVVAHIGAFDLQSYGDLLFPLVAAHELGRRCDAVLRPFSPFGVPALDASILSSWALGPATTARRKRVADAADLVLVGGGEIGNEDAALYAPFYGLPPGATEDLDVWYLAGPDNGVTPVVWHGAGVPAPPTDVDRWRRNLGSMARVGVRDHRSAQWLADAGVPEVSVTPDTALLVDRLCNTGELTRLRSRMLRAAGLPSERYAVLQGNAATIPIAADVARAIDAALPTDLGVVCVSTSPCHGDDEFAAAMRQLLDRPVHIPEDPTVSGILALLAAAELIVAVSLHAAITGVAHDRPVISLDVRGQSKIESFAMMSGRRSDHVTVVADLAPAIRRRLETPVDPTPRRDLQRQVDATFDDLASIASTAAGGRRSPELPEETFAPTWSWLGLPVIPRIPMHLGEPLASIAVDGPGTVDSAAAEEALSRRVAAATATERLHDDAALAAVRAGAIEHLESVLADQEAIIEEQRRSMAELQGAIAHLEGVVRAIENELERTIGRRVTRFLRRQRRDSAG